MSIMVYPVSDMPPFRNGRGAQTPRRSRDLPMSRTNRSREDETHGDEIIDADTIRVRRAFETDVRDYVTGDGGDVLLAESGKGAAWIQADPSDVLDAREWI